MGVGEEEEQKKRKTENVFTPIYLPLQIFVLTERC